MKNIQFQIGLNVEKLFATMTNRRHHFLNGKYNSHLMTINELNSKIEHTTLNCNERFYSNEKYLLFGEIMKKKNQKPNQIISTATTS